MVVGSLTLQQHHLSLGGGLCNAAAHSPKRLGGFGVVRVFETRLQKGAENCDFPKLYTNIPSEANLQNIPRCKLYMGIVGIYGNLQGLRRIFTEFIQTLV